MELKIGLEVLNVNRIFYLSPNGDDTNDGLSKQTPLKGFKETVKNKMSSGDALCFLPGSYLLDDAECSNEDQFIMRCFSDYNKQLIFFAESPIDTEIIINFNPSFNDRHHYLSLTNKSKAINLKFSIHSQSTNSSYSNALFVTNGNETYPEYINCLIEAESKGNISMQYYAYVKCINSTIIIKDELSNNYSGSVEFKNCILNKPVKNGNSLIFSQIDESIEAMDMNQLFLLRIQGDPNMVNTDKSPSIIGIFGGPFSEWHIGKFFIKVADDHYYLSPEGPLLLLSLEDGYKNKKYNSLFELSKAFKYFDSVSIIKI